MINLNKDLGNTEVFTWCQVKPDKNESTTAAETENGGKCK